MSPNAELGARKPSPDPSACAGQHPDHSIHQAETRPDLSHPAARAPGAGTAVTTIHRVVSATHHPDHTHPLSTLDAGRWWIGSWSRASSTIRTSNTYAMSTTTSRPAWRTPSSIKIN